MPTTYLDVEKPLAEIETKIAELSAMEAAQDAAMGVELSRLKQKSEKQLADIYARLDAWQKTQVARHPDRPHFRDYIAALVTDFVELSGDRKFAEDAAIVGGLGKFMGRPAVVMGHEKGRTTQERLKHNWGSPRPEAYRKAVRLMDLAEKFSLPVVSLIDTAGADCGIGAEERGQGEAIARSTQRCLTLGTPMVAVIVGEGASGGALAIGAANTVLMLEHAVYEVAEPGAASSILFRDASRARDLAIAMKTTAQDLLAIKVIDGIIEEPLGGAHRQPEKAIAAVGAAVAKTLDKLAPLGGEALRKQRRERYYAIGRNLPAATPAGTKVKK